MSAGVRVARGPWAVERGLLDDLVPWIDEAKRTPALLAWPVRIVVPSASLRAHTSAALVRRFGAAAGVRVQTLHRLALDVLEASGAPSPRGDHLLPTVFERLASRSPALSAQLEGLRDGYGIVAAAVSDLLDAGFELPLFDGVAEAIAEYSGGPVGDRARAVLEIAAASGAILAEAGLEHRSSLYRDARVLLETRGAAALPTRALFVHGYADATTVQADLIGWLVRNHPGRVWLDRPSDPSEPERDEPGNAFSDRFTQRMLDASGVTPGNPEPEALPRVEVVHAPGVQAEVRAIAIRLRALLDAGAEAERIGVVARAIGPYRVALRQHFSRLGIPFSGCGAAGPPDPARRRIEALLDLLRLGRRIPTERWLDLVERWPGIEALGLGSRADLLLGLHSLGAGRLEDVMRLEASVVAGDLALPQRFGFEAREGRGRRRRLDARWLRAARDAARDMHHRFDAWPARASLLEHRAALRGLLDDALGWAKDSAEARALDAAVLQGESGAPDSFVLDADELPALVERSLEHAASRGIGGRGAGVQLLEVMEARARTFEHLFVIGMNRGVFPRTINEDPLIPDRLRRNLRVTLPDLPVKGDGHDEERYLFAQLMAAAPAITLSCALCDDDGKARPVSPLLDALRFAPHVEKPQLAPAVFSAASLESDAAALRPAHEHARMAGLHGASRTHYGSVLALALAEVDAAPAGSAANDALARGRVAVLSELDPRGPLRASLGPYFGLVGPPVGSADPRTTDLYVTTVENLARCPWQGFLRRVLRLEPAPDPHAALPSAADSRLVGSLVHRVLERIALQTLGESSGELDAAVDRTPVDLAWPEPAALDALVATCAVEIVREEGIGLPGFPRVLALQAHPRIDLAREHGWTGGGFGAVAVESIGVARLRDHQNALRRIHFKADRVDRADGALRLVDYKTGKVPADQKTEDARVRALHKSVRRGELLQGVAYALAGAQLGHPESEGVYVHLVEGELAARTFTARASDQDFVDDFSQAVGTLLEVWDRGAFVPRLANPGSDEEPGTCEWCQVKEACLRGDSGARMRLAAWAEQAPAIPEAEIERAVLAVWNLPSEGE